MTVRVKTVTAPTLTFQQQEKALQPVMDAVRRDAERTSPRRTGKLARAHRTRFERRGRLAVGIVENVADHARYVHNGTGLYGPRRRKIYPRNASVLVFKSTGGKTVFAAWTRGQKPQPWLYNSLRRVVGSRARRVTR